MGMPQSKTTGQFFTITNFSTLDDIPSSTFESTMMDFNETLQDALAEQVSVDLPVITTTVTTIPSLVSSEATLTAPSTLPPIIEKVPATSVPLDASISAPSITLATAPSSSQPILESSIPSQQEATTPSSNPELPPWMEVVAPKRKKQVISPDEFDF